MKDTRLSLSFSGWDLTVSLLCYCFQQDVYEAGLIISEAYPLFFLYIYIYIGGKSLFTYSSGIKVTRFDSSTWEFNAKRHDNFVSQCNAKENITVSNKYEKGYLYHYRVGSHKKRRCSDMVTTRDGSIRRFFDTATWSICFYPC